MEKVLRGNEKPHMNKKLSHAIMKQSYLDNKANEM